MIWCWGTKDLNTFHETSYFYILVLHDRGNRSGDLKSRMGRKPSDRVAFWVWSNGSDATIRILDHYG